MSKRPKTGDSTRKSAAQIPTDWTNVADWYDQLVGESGSDYHRHVVLPGVVRLLAAQAGQEILDLACGQGVLCRLLALRGVRAAGVDAAPDLIRLARERNSALSAESSAHPNYYIGDARDLSFLPENRFDSAACILAIQNIHPIQPVFQSAARVLKPMGKLVIVMMHPAFRSPKETSWGWDDAKKVQYRRVDRYLTPRKHPITTHPGQKTGEYTWTFHKPIEAYVKPLRNAGLLVDAIEEWPSHKTSAAGPRAAAENTARKEIPMFLAMRGVKVPQLPAADEASTAERTPDDATAA
jgi:ubiquinone/menaquinone biosynthesis C-methylase UbiE